MAFNSLLAFFTNYFMDVGKGHQIDTHNLLLYLYGSFMYVSLINVSNREMC